MDYQILIPILSTIIIGLITNAIYDTARLNLPIGRTTTLSIRGIWVSSFYPKTGQLGHTIEVIKMHQRGNSVFFYIENYNSERQNITRMKGEGVINASQLSAYYYHKDRRNPDTGTFTLKIKGAKDGGSILLGVYTEHIDRENEVYPTPISQEAIMRKSSLPIEIQLRTLIGKPFFQNYDSAKEYFT